MSLDDREAGLTVYDVYPEPITYCQVCGNPVWHYWEFARADGVTLNVGQECARVVCGGSPAKYLRDEEERQRYEDTVRQEAARAAGHRAWWRAPEQRDLRRVVLLGARQERSEHVGQEFYARARKAARSGCLSEKFRAWVERQGADACAVVRRTAEAMRQLYALGWCRTGRDRDFIRDLTARVMPTYSDREIRGAPLSERQTECIAKMHHRYRVQISKLEAWQRAL